MFDFKFNWIETLDTGVAEVDKQHKQLFKIGRDMEQLLRIKCIGVTDQKLLDIVCQLRDYTGYHFYEEEKMMMEMNYVNIEKHKKEHKDCIDYIMNVDLPKLKADPEGELNKIKDEVQRWVFEHMLQEDIATCNAYDEFLKAQSEEPSDKEDVLQEDSFGYLVGEQDASLVYLDKNQMLPGSTILVYKGKKKELCKLAALERNTYFADLAKVTQALKSVYGISQFAFVAMESKTDSLHFTITPVATGEDYDLSMDDSVYLEQEHYQTKIKELRKILYK